MFSTKVAHLHENNFQYVSEGVVTLNNYLQNVLRVNYKHVSR